MILLDASPDDRKGVLGNVLNINSFWSKTMNTFLLRLAACLFVVVSSSSHAALVDRGTYVTDTVGGIDYLKFGQTVGYSFDQILNEDVLGFIAQGWSLTAAAPLQALAHDPLTASDAWHLIKDGYTDWFHFTDYNELETYENAPGYADYWWPHWNMPPETPYFYGVGNGRVLTASINYPVSLSRPSSIPVPAAAWLFGSALAGLLVARSKNKK